MTEEKRYELIEAWLAGELSGKSLEAFEAQLQSDEELALEVEIVRDLSTLNADTPRDRLRNTLSEIRNTTKEDKAPIPISWWLRNAAAALVLLVGAIFMFNQISKSNSPELVKVPPVNILTDEDEDGIVDFLEVEKEPKETEKESIIKEKIEANDFKKEIKTTPKEQWADDENEQIEYKLVPQIAEREVIVFEPQASYDIDASDAIIEIIEEHIPEYVSAPITNIRFYNPEHETTIEEDEAERQTAEEMERINRMANENIESNYEIVDGDTIEVLSSVASAVVYVADVPEKRINFLLEFEKEKLKEEIVKLDSLIFDTYYENEKMLSFKYEGSILEVNSNQIGFYIFSQNAYDFINNEFLFFEKLEKGSEGDFLIENQIPVPYSMQKDFYLYGVFVDEISQEILSIDKMQIGY